MVYNNILLIDDDEDDREIFLSAVEKIPGTSCIAISSAVEALSMLTSEKLMPEIIFLDLNMPIMTGLQFLEAIKNEEKLKQIPIIIFSTSSNPNSIADAKALGAHNYIVKPYTYNELTVILERLL